MPLDALKVVLDTNLLVSAFISPRGAPARVLQLVFDRVLRPAVSPALLEEYEEVLSRAKFRLDPDDVRRTLEEMRRLAVEVAPSEPLRACRDRKDDKFLECAVAAEAAFLITGNAKDFPRRFGGVEVVAPAPFLKALGVR